MTSAFLMKSNIEWEKLEWGSRAWLTRLGEKHAESLVVVEVDLAMGFGHDFHLHPGQDELIYVLEGRVEQWIETEMRILEAGDSSFVARNTVHASFNVTEGPARVLAVLAPAVGDDGYEVVEVAKDAPWRDLR
jgi:quercetin dioxygenase-like cupin family protein